MCPHWPAQYTNRVLIFIQCFKMKKPVDWVDIPKLFMWLNVYLIYTELGCAAAAKMSTNHA